MFFNNRVYFLQVLHVGYDPGQEIGMFRQKFEEIEGLTYCHYCQVRTDKNITLLLVKICSVGSNYANLKNHQSLIDQVLEKMFFNNKAYFLFEGYMNKQCFHKGNSENLVFGIRRIFICEATSNILSELEIPYCWST